MQPASWTYSVVVLAVVIAVTATVVYRLLSKRLAQLEDAQRQAQAELAAVRAHQRAAAIVEGMPVRPMPPQPSKPKRDGKRSHLRVVRDTGVALAALFVALATWFARQAREHPVRLVAGVGGLGAAVVGSMFLLPDMDDGPGGVPNGPPAAVGTPTPGDPPKSADSPSPGPDGGESAPTPTPPDLEVPGDLPTDVGPPAAGEPTAPTNSPTATDAPLQPSPSGTPTPTPEPSPTLEPPEPPEPSEPPPSPTPTEPEPPEPTVTLPPETPTPTPTADDRPLVCVEVEELVGLCVDVPLVGDLLDELLPSRYRVK